MSDLDLWSRLRTGDWLDEQVFPPLRYAVPGIIPEGFGLLAAPPKAGKSWFALGVLLDVARGARTLGGVDTGPARPVLYMALEDGDRRLQGRARKLLGDGVPIPANFTYLIDAHPEEVAPLIADWLEVHGGSSPLIVLDTLGKVLPPARPGDGAYQRDYQVGGGLKRIVDAHPGSCLLAVHHTRKASSEDFMDSVSGTNGLNGAADFTLVLTRSRQDDRGTLKVTGRDVIEAEYALTVTDGLWTLDGGGLAAASAAVAERRESDGLGDLSQQVLAAVRDAPGGGVSPKSVAAVVLDLDNDGASTYLRRLAESGRIRKVGRGRYAPVERVSEPFEVFETMEGDHLDSDTSNTALPRIGGEVEALTRHSDTSNTSNTPPIGEVCPECNDPACDGSCWEVTR